MHVRAVDTDVRAGRDIADPHEFEPARAPASQLDRLRGEVRLCLLTLRGPTLVVLLVGPLGPCLEVINLCHGRNVRDVDGAAASFRVYPGPYVQVMGQSDFEAFPPGPFTTILADPPWRFRNRRGKASPEYERLSRYRTMALADICALPVAAIAAENAHLYLWTPNALLPSALDVMNAWGFTYVTNVVWLKVRIDGGPDGSGTGSYFRNVTELVLFGVRGKLRTASPGRTQVNLISARKREHSRKPDDLYDVIEACSPGPSFEMFCRHPRPGWTSWGDQVASNA
jgi:N6-adenosine-specific RNA methylase IME4